MDFSNSTPAAATLVKTPEAQTEINSARTHVQSKPSHFNNGGVLKRHAPLHHHHHPVVVVFKDCLKNHAASLGGHAVDGCGEFMPSPASNPADPTSLKCAACGCHRNFHRREPDEPPPNPIPALEYQPLHRHHPMPPVTDDRRNSSSSRSPNNSPSPPPISSSYYPPSAPHMLLALSSHGLAGHRVDRNIIAAVNTSTPSLSSSPNGRKRFRTKFTRDQKGKMQELAEKLGWRMQKRDEGLISDFCSEIGVERVVFKVWMHNNKNSSICNKDQLHDNTNNSIAIGGAGSISTTPATAAHHHREESNNDVGIKSCSIIHEHDLIHQENHGLGMGMGMGMESGE